MKYEEFNDAQKDAISSRNVDGKKNIIVSAGAGSGKTEVLTQRVLYFNKNKNFKLDEFLILTFTKLAAGEMKERIRKTLKEEGLEDANIVDTCDICTFDSYAFSIVKKYHYLLKLSPNIRIIDSSVISVQIRNIVKDIFEEYYKSGNKNFATMIEKYCFKDDKEFVDLAVKLHSKACLDIDFSHYVDTFIQKYYYDNKELYENMFTEEFDILKKIISNDDYDFKEIINNLPKLPVPDDDSIFFNREIQSAFRKFLNSQTYDDYMVNFPLELDVKTPKNMNTNQVEAVTEFYRIYEEIKEFVETHYKTKKQFNDMLKFNEMAAGVLIEIVKELENRIQLYKKEHQIYEFNDIAKLALKLVRENKDVRDSIKNKLKMIMIDEYQDTSILQEKFIEQIQDNNVYMVGDIKQSIYRFRNARSDIFRDKYEAYKNGDGGVAIDLNTNYRSRKEVLDDINYMFERIMTIDQGGANYVKDHVIEYGNKAYLKAGNDGEDKHLETILYNSSEVEYDEKPILEANLIVKDIVNKINNHYKVFDKENKVLRDCTFSDFCILMDRDADFETYIKIFNEYNVPLYAESDENISSNEDIKVYANILRLIRCVKNGDYKSNEFNHSFVSLARSYMFCYSDEKLYELAKNNDYKNDDLMKKIKEIVLNNPNLPLYNLFSKIIFELDIYSKFINVGSIDKHERYLDTFMEKFKEMSEINYTLDDFLTYLEYVDEYSLKITLSSKGSSLDSVRIMNIHKSKGLEFPIIYFSGLYKGFNRSDINNEYNISEHVGLIIPPIEDENGERPSKNLLHTYHKEKEIAEEISEKIRLFYVDVTRTKEKMIFVIGGAPFNLEFKEILKNIQPLHGYLGDTNISETDKLKLLFEKFKNQEINYSSLVYACDKYNLRLSKNFVSERIESPIKKLEKKRAYTYSKLVTELQEEDELKVKMKNLLENVEILFEEYVKEEYERIIKKVKNVKKAENMIEYLNSKGCKEDFILKYLFETYRDNSISLLEYKIALEIIGKKMVSYIEKSSKENLNKLKWNEKTGRKYFLGFYKYNSFVEFDRGNINFQKVRNLFDLFMGPNNKYSISKYLYDKAISGNMEIEEDFNIVEYEISLNCLKKCMGILGYELKESFAEDYTQEQELKDIEEYVDYMFDEKKQLLTENEIFKEVLTLYKNKEITKIEFELLIFYEVIKLPCLNTIKELIYNDIEEYKNEKTKDDQEEYKPYIPTYLGNHVSEEFINYLKKHLSYKLNRNFVELMDRQYQENEAEENNYAEWLETNPGEYDEYIPLIDYEKHFLYDTVVNYLLKNDLLFVGDINYEELAVYNNENVLENEEIVRMLIESYLNKEIDFSTLEGYLDFVNYKLSDEAKNNINTEIKYAVEDIPGRKFYELGLENLQTFFVDFINYRHFNKTYGDIEIKSDYPCIEKKQIEYKSLEIKDLNVNKEEIIYSRSSKDLKATSSKNSLDFGNDIHFMMEVTDFKNPDYSAIGDEYFVNIVKRFLSSSLMEKVQDAEIYKEYEFVDNKENVNGIIDLMLVYDDHIDIIDYKTKNIDDEGYDKQLNTYKKYINIKLNKPVNTYLYSLLTGEIKEVK